MSLRRVYGVSSGDMRFFGGLVVGLLLRGDRSVVKLTVVRVLLGVSSVVLCGVRRGPGLMLLRLGVVVGPVIGLLISSLTPDGKCRLYR